VGVETKRYVIYGGQRLREDIYLAFMPTWREIAKETGEPIFALTEIVKTSKDGTSYLVATRRNRRGQVNKRILEFGIKTSTGEREDFTHPPRLEYSSGLLAKVQEFQQVFGRPSYPAFGPPAQWVGISCDSDTST
jgi:hypothetical protein